MRGLRRLRRDGRTITIAGYSAALSVFAVACPCLLVRLLYLDLIAVLTRMD